MQCAWGRVIPTLYLGATSILLLPSLAYHLNRVDIGSTGGFGSAFGELHLKTLPSEEEEQ